MNRAVCVCVCGSYGSCGRAVCGDLRKDCVRGGVRPRPIMQELPAPPGSSVSGSPAPRARHAAATRSSSTDPKGAVVTKLIERAEWGASSTLSYEPKMYAISSIVGIWHAAPSGGNGRMDAGRMLVVPLMDSKKKLKFLATCALCASHHVFFAPPPRPNRAPIPRKPCSYSVTGNSQCIGRRSTGSSW